ncbi:unnamed protein product [Malus baccata var. baccata]
MRGTTICARKKPEICYYFGREQIKRWYPSLLWKCIEYKKTYRMKAAARKFEPWHVEIQFCKEAKLGSCFFRDLRHRIRDGKEGDMSKEFGSLEGEVGPLAF